MSISARLSLLGSLLATTISIAQTEPPHPILTISGSSSGASSILSTYTETQYLDFVPRQGPRSEATGFGGAVVSGDTGWSWSASTPNQITSTPSGTVFPNNNPAYPLHTQTITVLSGQTVNAPYYIRAGTTTGKSLVHAVIDHKKRGKLRGDLLKLAVAYMESGTSHATRNQAYARRIAVALDDWANYVPHYFMTEKNSPTYINAGPSYVLAEDEQRASDHNGLAHEWEDDELQAFDAIYDSPALAQLSTEKGYDVRAHITNDLFCNFGDFFVNRVPINVATNSNLSGPYVVLAETARVLNRPDYILWLKDYLEATVTDRVKRDGTKGEGLSYSYGYINTNKSTADNVKAYFNTRPADTPELVAAQTTANFTSSVLAFGQTQHHSIRLPDTRLPAFGDTNFDTSGSNHSGYGASALLPAYGHVAMGTGSGVQATQTNQSFCADGNHMREDIAAFTFWAKNNELMGNNRYFNGMDGRGYTDYVLSHNTVTIDRSSPSRTGGELYGNGNLTLYEPGNSGIAVTEIDGQRAYSNKASRYQRIMLLNTMDLDRPYVLDVFRVTGGTTHDYTLHGSIRFDQTWESSVPLTANPAQYPLLEGSETFNTTSCTPYYGCWREVSSISPTDDLNITYRDTNRTSQRDLRLWITDSGNSTVYAAKTPVAERTDSVPDNLFTKGYWRPSTMLRRRIGSGTQQSLFVNVIEPLSNATSTIQSVERVPITGGGNEAVTVRVTFIDGRIDTYLVNLKNPKVAGATGGSDTISTSDGNYTLTGRIGAFFSGSAGKRAWSIAASNFQYPGGQLNTPGQTYTGSITGETRKATGGADDAFITNASLPIGTALQGKHLSMLFGTLTNGNKTGISEMFVIDQVKDIGGQRYICFSRDHELEISGTTATEQMHPQRTFSGTNNFELMLSSSTPSGLEDLTVFAGGTVQVPFSTGNLGATPNGSLQITATSSNQALMPNANLAISGSGTDRTLAITPTAGQNGTATITIAISDGINTASSSFLLTVTSTNSPYPVARLTFDDGTANDSSGNGNNGILVNGASVVADADRGNVLLLDGTDDYVSLGNGGSLILSDNNQGTITAWVKIAVSKSHHSIVTKGEWKDAYSLLISGSTSSKDKLWTGNDTGVFSADPVPVGVWTHVAVTINGDLTTFYINGQVSGTANQDRGNPIDNTNTAVCIGREQYAGSMPAGRWFFNGRLDDVRIYEKALDQAAIQLAMAGSTNVNPELAAIGNKTGNEGSQLSFTATATDSDAPGQSLTFSLDAGAPAGAAINASSGVFTWTPTETQGPGTYNVTVRVTDNGSPNLSASETIQITVNEVNATPALAAIGNKTVNEGSTLSFTTTAADSDVPVQTLTFSLDAGAPAGASINSSSGAFTWTPTEADGPGTYIVTVRVTDNGSPNLNDSETIQITVNEVNTAPVLAAIGNKSVNEGSVLTFTASATDGDVPAQALTYSLDTGAPSGASINATSGAFTWTPSEAQGPSTNSVTVRVTDSMGGTDSETIQITVAEVNAAPVLAAIGNKSATVGTPLTFTASATDSDLPAQPLTYSFDAGAPSGASINASSGAFTWTPAAVGTSNVTVRVTDSLGGTASETIQITVIDADVGTGLIAEYYDNSDFTGTKVTRTDATVNFTWGTSPPDPAIGADTFSVRWMGQVKPLYSETYTFYTRTDDGVRLWVNGQLLVDKWVNQVATEWSGTITLVAGQKYDIKIEYYENTGSASASLSWSSASQAKQIVPQIQLYPTTSLPSPWLTTNIGTVSQTGSVSHSNGVYTVTGAGSDIWGTSDNFRFVYQTLSGDGEIKARVSSATGPSTWSKIGVMIRESLNANSANAMMLITPTTSNGFSFQLRASTGASSSQTLGGPLNAAPNNWVRLVRSGNTLTGYKSADGVTWTQVGTSVTITMASNIYIGLAVTAHNSTGTATGVFDNVTVVP
jgi:hypothetical protein